MVGGSWVVCGGEDARSWPNISHRKSGRINIGRLIWALLKELALFKGQIDWDVCLSTEGKQLGEGRNGVCLGYC